MELKQRNKKPPNRPKDQQIIQRALHIQLNLANALNDTNSLEEGLALCLDAAIEASALDCGGIYLFDEASGDLKMLVHKGLSQEFVDSTTVYRSDSENAKLIMKGEPFYINYYKWEEPLEQIVKDSNVHAVAVLPIKHKNAVIGCLNVASYFQDNISNISRLSLEMIAVQLGTAISKLKSDSALRESEERYRITIERSIDGIALSEGGRYSFVNSAYLKIFGYARPDEIIGKEITVTVHPDDKARVQHIYNLRLQGKKAPEMYEFKGIRKDGSPTHIEITATKISHKGRPMMLGYFRDITEKKKAEEALKKSERKFKAFFENLPMGAVISTKYFEPTMVNQFYADMLGYSRDELQSLFTADAQGKMLDPEDFIELIQHIEKLRLREIPTYRAEQRFIKKDGGIVYGDLSISIVFDENGRETLAILSILDITERKRAEQALKEAQERYAALFDRSFDCVYLHDFEGNYIDGNPAVLRLTGYTKEEIRVLNFSDLITPDQLAEAAESNEAILRQGSEEKIRRYKIKTKHNGIRDIETRGSLIYRDGAPYAIQGIARDVTDQERMSTALKESESKFRSLFENSPYPCCVTTLKNGTLMDVNHKFCESTGYTQNELIGRSTTELRLFTGKNRTWILNQLKKSGKADGLEFDARTKEGKIRTYIISAALININHQLSILSMFMDVTDMKRLESQLRQSQKMESIGTLAGGIAHDFNNILGIILGNAELAKLRRKETIKVGKNVDQIIDASLRGKQIIRQLLDFSRQRAQTRYPLSLSPLIKESLKLLRPLIPAHIDIRQSYDDDSVTALVDPTEIHQVIMNLCTNASLSISEQGGVIDMALDTVVINEKNKGQFEDVKPGRYVRLRVGDTGNGIAPENLDRVFEPYFTTREAGSGSGLGLSVVHGIIKECRGTILVSSRPGQGTTFTILLPVVDEGIHEDFLSENRMLPAGNENVLFVEDEHPLGVAAIEMLEKLGYRARHEKDPSKALKLFVSNPDQFDLVITDMAMPKMTGAELAKEIFKIKPDMPVILCTGYHKSMDEKKARKIGFKAFLKKPVKVEVMAEAVRNVLDGK